MATLRRCDNKDCLDFYIAEFLTQWCPITRHRREPKKCVRWSCHYCYMFRRWLAMLSEHIRKHDHLKNSRKRNRCPFGEACPYMAVEYGHWSIGLNKAMEHCSVTGHWVPSLKDVVIIDFGWTKK